MYTNIHIYICMYTCTYVHLYILIMYVYICMYIYICIYVYISYLYSYAQGLLLEDRLEAEADLRKNATTDQGKIQNLQNANVALQQVCSYMYRCRSSVIVKILVHVYKYTHMRVCMYVDRPIDRQRSDAIGIYMYAYISLVVLMSVLTYVHIQICVSVETMIHRHTGKHTHTYIRTHTRAHVQAHLPLLMTDV